MQSNFNIFLHELKYGWKVLLVWTIGIASLIAGGLSKYEGYAAASKESLDQLMSALPPQLMAIFGGPEADLTNILTFFSVLYLYLALLAATHAVFLGAGILAKEERDKTAEFLYVKPRSRFEILTQKIYAASATVVILNIIITVQSLFFVAIYNKSGQSINGEVLLLMLGLLMVQFIFLSLGLLLAAALQNPKRSAPISAAIMMTMFLLSVLIDLSSDLSDLKYFTPFKYFDAKVINSNGSLDSGFVLLGLILIISMISGSYYLYNRRDLEI